MREDCDPPADNVALAEAAARFLDRGLTGFDLAGPEHAYPDPLEHREAFEAARAAGLRITVHAGEWDGPTQVRRALESSPERIAHGAVAAQDAKLCAELMARGVALDLAPTSNVQAGIVPSLETHPLATLHRVGVRVTLSTDDLTVSDISLTDEYERAIAQCGLTLPELWLIDRGALDVAFAEAAVLEPLRRQFDRWAAAEPAVGAGALH